MSTSFDPLFCFANISSATFFPISQDLRPQTFPFSIVSSASGSKLLHKSHKIARQMQLLCYLCTDDSLLTPLSIGKPNRRFHKSSLILQILFKFVTFQWIQFFFLNLFEQFSLFPKQLILLLKKTRQNLQEKVLQPIFGHLVSSLNSKHLMNFCKLKVNVNFRSRKANVQRPFYPNDFSLLKKKNTKPKKCNIPKWSCILMETVNFYSLWNIRKYIVSSISG